MRIPAIAGAGLVFVLALFLSVLMGGESAAKAKSMAAEQLGNNYRYHVSSLNIRTNNQGKFLSGVVTAWRDGEVKSIPVSWEEH